ncbi:MAG: DNA-directed RNA polymerase subunit omega [Clostridiales bacterium]|jgi:DNA-directed RNA polymerase subunit omega|nr:DNA-directed RNA polymerase subunit omega [Clostridiales bacterium]
MVNPSIDQLLEIIEDRYSLIAATSKRARQILESEQYEEQESITKPVSIAAKEIFEGKVKCINCK